MLPLGAAARQARETRSTARFRNLNSAVLMQRLTMSGAVIDAGLTATHLSVIQVIAAFAPRDGWHLEGEAADAKIVSGEAYPSQALIAAKVGRSERQVKTLIRQAAEAGFLSKTMTTHQRRDACGGTIPIRRNFYRVRLPAVCAADGADGVRAAMEDQTQLRLRRPDTSVPDSPDRGSRSHPEGEAHFPTEGKPTSHDPSVPSDPSIAAAAAIRSAEKRCDGIPDPDGKPTTVILRRAPGTDGKPNGSGVVEATGETVAVTVEAWNLAGEGRAGELRLQTRTRTDGTAYLWLDRAPRQRREDRACAAPARNPTDGAARLEDGTTAILTADEVRRAPRRPSGAGNFVVIQQLGGVVQIEPETFAAIERGEPISVEFSERKPGVWRQARQIAVPVEDEIPW
jgi:hypothetical protein